MGRRRGLRSRLLQVHHSTCRKHPLRCFAESCLIRGKERRFAQNIVLIFFIFRFPQGGLWTLSPVRRLLWYARIPSSSHLTEMLALICSAYGTWKPGKSARLTENTPQPD